jgi:hypothetical protein
MNTARAAMLLLLCSLSSTAGAQETLTPPVLPPGEDRITALQEGTRAPHSGMLLDTDTAIRWTNRLTWWPEAVRLHIAEDAAVLDALRRSHELELGIVRDSFTREITGLREDLVAAVRRYEGELNRYRNPPVWEQWGFAFGMGVLAAGLVVGVLGGLLASI